MIHHDRRNPIGRRGLNRLLADDITTILTAHCIDGLIAAVNKARRLILDR